MPFSLTTPNGHQTTNTPAPSMLASSRSSASSNVTGGINDAMNTTQRRRGGTSLRNRDLIRKARAAPPDAFAMKYNTKHHAHSWRIAPYPLNYEKATLDLDAFDHCAFTKARGSLTVATFPEPPKLVLDLGCGDGTWILEVARMWPDTHFVGFDLVPVQPDVSRYPELLGRIEWVHGNFLTSALPFSDDHFDMVYARGLGLAVPEDKWDFMLAEVARVLKPDGQIELVVDDIIFPYLPLPSTHPLTRQQATQHPKPPPLGTSGVPPTVADLPFSALTPRAQDALAFYTPSEAPGSDPESEEEEAPHIFSLSLRPRHPKRRESRSRPPVTGPQTLREEGSSRSLTSSLPRLSKQTTKSSGSEVDQPMPQVHLPTPPVSNAPSVTSPLRQDTETSRHAHEWLADLFYSMLERRFINTMPTRLLANAMNVYFSKVTASQRVQLPLPGEGGIFARDENLPIGGDSGLAGGFAQTQERRRASSSPAANSAASAGPSPLSIFSPISSPAGLSRPSTFPSLFSPGSLGLPSPAPSPVSPAIVIDGVPAHPQTQPSASAPSHTSHPPSSFSPLHFAQPPTIPPTSILGPLPLLTDAKLSTLISSTQGTWSVFSAAPIPHSSAPSPSPPPSHSSGSTATSKTIHRTVFSRPSTANGPDPLDSAPIHSRKLSGLDPFSASLSARLSMRLRANSAAPNFMPAEEVGAPEAAPSSGISGEEELALSGDAMALQVERAFRIVVACKEAMWEEFAEQQGLVGDKDLAAKQRRTFDIAMENYIVDMQSRTSLPDALVKILHWTKPKKAPPTPAQQMKERQWRRSRTRYQSSTSPSSISSAIDPNLLSPGVGEGGFNLSGGPSSADSSVTGDSLLHPGGVDDSEDPPAEEAFIMRGSRTFTGVKAMFE